MSKITTLPAYHLFPLVEDLLALGKSVKITVTGNSMYPFLRSGKDCVELVRTDCKLIRPDDIVMIRRQSGEYILHRVCKVDAQSFFIRGDAQFFVEGPIYPQQLMAQATAVWRGQRRIDCSGSIWVYFSVIWRYCLLPRRVICKILRLFRLI